MTTMKTITRTPRRSYGRQLAARLAATVRAGLLARRDFRLMWLASTVTSFGGQITLLALPLTAVTMLDATPSQMGILVAFEALPFSLLSLHAGVVVDRMRRLPIMLVCEAINVDRLGRGPGSASPATWRRACKSFPGRSHCV